MEPIHNYSVSSCVCKIKFSFKKSKAEEDNKKVKKRKRLEYKLLWKRGEGEEAKTAIKELNESIYVAITMAIIIFQFNTWKLR